MRCWAVCRRDTGGAQRCSAREATPDVRREQVAELRRALVGVEGAQELLTDADALVEKSIWLIGGDAGPTISASAASTTC
ncbi:Uncharacterised protein [Raoultella terrigena]|uniref:Uncharacterized protein n=1 Tax=Raoultella terrigena TaxID=577 RepID=A0A4U9CV17_RAOTE|nr:Uncharacterised protein [Raoultella terrigena]